MSRITNKIISIFLVTFLIISTWLLMFAGYYEIDNGDRDNINMVSFLSSVSITSIARGPYDRVEADIVTECNRRVFQIEGEILNGLLVTEDGVPVVDPTNSSVTIAIGDGNFTNGSGTPLSFMLDSRTLDRHYHVLRSGTTYVRPTGIMLDDEVVLINIITRGNDMMPIYAFRRSYTVSFGRRLNPARWRPGGMTNWRFYCMNNRLINSNYIATIEDAVAWYQNLATYGRFIGASLFPPLGVAAFIALLSDRNSSFHVVDILDELTLHEARARARAVIYHPWPRLRYDLNRFIRTEDNEYIFVRPNRRGVVPGSAQSDSIAYQLTSDLASPLFCTKSGAPVVWYRGDVVAIRFKDMDRTQMYLEQVSINDAVITSVQTEEIFLNSNIPFYIARVRVYFGEFDMLVFRTGGTDDAPIWEDPAGNVVNDIINDMRISTVLDPSTVLSFLRGGLLDGNGDLGWLGWITLVGSVILVIVIIGALMSLLSTILAPIGAVAAKGIALKKMMGGKKKK